VAPASPDLEEVQERLGYRFSKPELLRLALTHPSVAHETTAPTPHNQRLEFLGDAVLGLVLTQELYERFSAVSEGPLTKARAQMVNRRSLADQAKRFQIGQFLILSRGEESSGGREKQSALADAFEAILGAVFIDGGFDAARDFILGCFRDSFGQLARIPDIDNPKGELQEKLQSQSPDAPCYETTSVTGPDHDRVFECAVFHAGKELGRGTGKSKKAAESRAALAALAALEGKKTAKAPAKGRQGS
jgi:ribonuclease III